MVTNKVLIIGSGLVGVFCGSALHKCGTEVVIADINPSKEYIIRYGGDFSIESVDVLDRIAIDKIVAQIKPDVIVFAAGFSYKSTLANPNAMLQFCKDGTRNVVESAVRYGVEKLIYLSSFAVYGASAFDKKSFFISEITRLAPESLYAQHKLLAEKQLMSNCYSGLAIIPLRVCGIYGPIRSNKGSKSATLMEKTLLACLDNSEIEVELDHEGDEYIYIKDLADCIKRIVSTPSDAKGSFVLNVGSGYIVGPGEFQSIINTMFPRNKIRFKFAGHERIRLPLDCSRAKLDFGFSPKFNLTTGIIDYVEELSKGMLQLHS